MAKPRHLSYERDYVVCQALMHLIYRSGANNFAFIENIQQLSEDVMEMLHEQDRAIRHRDCHMSWIPIYEDGMASLVAIQGVKVFLRATLEPRVREALYDFRQGSTW